MQNATNNPAPADAATSQPMTSPSIDAVQAAAAPANAVDASACCGGCAGGAKPFVYAIGELRYGFPSVLRQQSVQQNMDHIETVAGHFLQAHNSQDFLRHLFGFKEVELDVNIGNVKSLEVKTAIYRLQLERNSESFTLSFGEHKKTIKNDASASAIESTLQDMGGLTGYAINVEENPREDSEPRDLAKELLYPTTKKLTTERNILKLKSDSEGLTSTQLWPIGRLRVTISSGDIKEGDINDWKQIKQIGFNGLFADDKTSELNTCNSMIVRHVHQPQDDGTEKTQVIYVDIADPDESGQVADGVLGVRGGAHYCLPMHSHVTHAHRSNMHDASAVIWKLNRGQMEVYGILPDGNFAESAYRELAEFHMNQCGLTKGGLDFHYYEKDGRRLEWEFAWDPCFNDRNGWDSEEREKYTNAPHAEPLVQERSERVAIPGVIQGEVQLITGVRLPAIKPDMRGTAEWSQARMLDILLDAVRHSSQGIELTEPDRVTLTGKIRRIIERLDHSVRNPGLAPEHRALNHAATRLFVALGEVAGELMTNDPAAVGATARTYELDDIVVKPSEIGYAGSDCWDVEVSFFNPNNKEEALVVVAQTIDVNDTIPALTDKPRKFRRR